ncbi:MAG: hypothetical protein ABIK18_03195 [candidate division WOR-3 bacterium]
MKFYLLLLPNLLLAQVPNVNVLRWVSPDSSKPKTFREWRSSFSPTQSWWVKSLSINNPGRPESEGNKSQPRVDILVQDSLVPAISAELETLKSDLLAEGYDVALFAVSGTSCESLRAFLQNEYQRGLIAAVLIGNLPVPWFQMIDDWDNDYERDPDEGYEEFPCDLFLMDLDGIWEDSRMRYGTFDSLISGVDSIYDDHYGDIEPEIGISRIYVSTIGNEDSLIKDYLSRCHLYRTQELPVIDRALVYIDDDWEPWAGEWDSCVGLLYLRRVFISDPEETRVLDYQPRIDTAPYQWIQLCAHSWPGGHAMKFAQGDSWDWFYADWIPGLDPEVCFYNLFACSNVRFVEQGYCGGMYVFTTSSGLAAIGSTKTGSMLAFEDFYGPLGSNNTLAEAFRHWFTQRAQDGFEPWEKSWFYGMCLIGDGLLKPKVYTPIAEEQTTPPTNGSRLTATIVRKVLIPYSAVSGGRSEVVASLLDISGRKVMELSPGPNDVSRLPAGVYFLRDKERRTIRSVTIIH